MNWCISCAKPKTKYFKRITIYSNTAFSFNKHSNFATYFGGQFILKHTVG